MNAAKRHKPPTEVVVSFCEECGELGAVTLPSRKGTLPKECTFCPPRTGSFAMVIVARFRRVP